MPEKFKPSKQKQEEDFTQGVDYPTESEAGFEGLMSGINPDLNNDEKSLNKEAYCLERPDAVERIDIMREMYKNYYASGEQMREWDKILRKDGVIEQTQIPINLNLNATLAPASTRDSKNDLAFKKLLNLVATRAAMTRKSPELLKHSFADFDLSNEIGYYKRLLKKLETPEIDAFPQPLGRSFYDETGLFIKKDKFEQFERYQDSLGQLFHHEWTSRIPFIDDTSEINHRFALEFFRYSDAVQLAEEYSEVFNKNMHLPKLETYEELTALRKDFHNKVVNVFLSMWEKTIENNQANGWFDNSMMRIIIARQAIYAENFGMPVENAEERMARLV